MCETWVVSFKFNVGNSWTRAISMSKATKTIDSKFTLYRLYRDPVNLPAENVVSCLPEGCPAPGKFREVQMSNITMLRLLVVLSEMLVEDIYIIVIYESIYIVVVQAFWQPSHFHFGHQLLVLNWRGQNDTVDQKRNELMATMKLLH